MLNVFYISGIIGLACIILGVLIKSRNRKARDIVYIFGGILLAIYSFYIKDNIFIVLQVIFILVAIYDLIKQNTQRKKR